jgi:phytol kinase
MLENDWIALVVTFAAALAWLRLNNFMALKGWVSSNLSRKLIHIGTGPLFVLCWLLFSPAPSARWLAALVPFAITIQFILVGLGVIGDEAAVRSMSRSGDRAEILRGPLYYGIVFVLLTLVYWREEPIGMIALMMMCGGDGLADLVGRRYGTARLPWNANKSWAGSLAVLLGGLALSTVILGVFIAVGAFPQPLTAYLPGLTLTALAVTLVESLPFKDVDNLTITLAALAVGFFVL